MKLDEEKLKFEVSKRGMNQADLINQSGISRTTISKIYNGGSCSPKTAIKLCEVLETELEKILKTKQIPGEKI